MHDGEEFLYIIAGRLNILLHDENYQLRAGESFHFTSNALHSWINPGKTESTILWIKTPPTF